MQRGRGSWSLVTYRALTPREGNEFWAARFSGRPFFVVGSFCCAPLKDAANVARKREPFEQYHWRWKMSTHYIGAAVQQPCGVRKSGLQDPGRLKDVKVIPRLGNPLLSPN